MAARAYSLVFLLFLTTWLSGCNDQDDAAKAASDAAQRPSARCRLRSDITIRDD